MSNLGCADEEAAGEKSDGEHSPTPSVDTKVGHPNGTCLTARKRSSSSQTTSNR